MAEETVLRSKLSELALVVFALSLLTIGFQAGAAANDTDSISTGSANVTNSPRPILLVDQNCPIASTIIPGSYNASGFPPNAHLGVVIKSENQSPAPITNLSSPFTGIHNDITDSEGTIQGEFKIDTTKGSGQGYQLEIFVDKNRDDVPDGNFQTATSPLGC